MVARNWNRVTAKDVEEYNRLYGKELGYVGPKVAKGLRFLAAFEGFVPRETANKVGSILGFGNFKTSKFASPGFGYAKNKGWDKRGLTIPEGIALWRVHMNAGWGKDNVDRLEELDEQSLIPAMDVGWHASAARTKDHIEDALAGDKIVRNFPVDLRDAQFGVVTSRNNARREMLAGTPMEELEKREARYVAIPPSHTKKRVARKPTTTTRQDYTQYVQDETPAVQAQRLRGFKELEDVIAEYAAISEEESEEAARLEREAFEGARNYQPLSVYGTPSYVLIEQFMSGGRIDRNAERERPTTSGTTQAQ